MRLVRIDPKRSRTWLWEIVGEEVFLSLFLAENAVFG